MVAGSSGVNATLPARRWRPFATTTYALSALALLLALSTACQDSATAELPAELETWIGQMLLVGFRGTELAVDSPFLQTVRDLHLGGVILFDYDVPAGSRIRNIESAEQVQRLVSRLQEVASIPLLIAIDQEGGRIARLKPVRDFPETRSQAVLGGLDDPTVTRENAALIAATLADLGINLNLAPVLDLALNPDNPVIAGLERSYGADPELVARHAGLTIDEFHKQGVLSSLKHFPGHGSSREDSHLGLPDVSQNWKEIELEPFRRLIERGLADSIMTAHLFNQSWDPVFPATLSPRVIQGMLRNELGFDGVVISDDMQMGAIVENFSFARSIQLAIEAGVDLLAISNNQVYDPQAPARAIKLIRSLVEEGQIDLLRIRQSFERIQKLKQRIGKPTTTG